MTTLNTTKTGAATVINEHIINKFIDSLDTSGNTVISYSKDIRQFYKWLSAQQIEQPNKHDLLNYKRYLLETNHKPATVNAYIISLRLFFSFLESESLYDNIASTLKLEKLSKEHRKDYLTTKQVAAILESIDTTHDRGKRDYAMFLLMVTCGLRDIEIARANVEDLQQRGNKTVLYIQGKGKTDKTDYVIVPAMTEKAIRDYLRTRSRAQAADNAPLFANERITTANHLTPRSVSRIIKNTLINAGYDSKRLTAHSLRHTAVTLAVLNGEEIQNVQQFARHTNIATTMIYFHEMDKQNNTCSAAIENALFNDMCI